MKRLSLVLSATVVGTVVWGGYSPPAHAAPTHSTGVVVTDQDAGAACTATNNTVVLVDPYTGTETAQFGKPPGMTGTINEAKPIARNTKVVAVWGGNPSGPGGVGVFTRSGATGGSWTMPITFPNTFERATATTGNNPHSVAMLPDGSYAVAQTGTITGQNGSGFVVVSSPTGPSTTTSRWPARTASSTTRSTASSTPSATRRSTCVQLAPVNSPGGVPATTQRSSILRGALQ